MWSKKLEEAVIRLLKTANFYAHFISECRVVRDFKSDKGNIAVAVISGTPTLLMDGEWFDQLSTKEAARTLSHEMDHLLLDHLRTVKDEGKQDLIDDIAKDCSINQYNTDDLPEGGVTFDIVNKMCGGNLEPNQTSDYYYEHLMKHVKNVQASGIKPHDDHSKQEGQDCEEVSRAVVYKAAKRALNASAGNAPQHVIKAIESLGEAKLPWKMLLRNSIMSQVSRKTQSTTKKINRRFQLPVPGKKKKREMILGVCVDESGSVSDEAHAAFMSEIQQISKLVTKTYIVHADCEVAAVDDLSKGKFKAERKASGGTMYQPAIDKCIQLKCNMIVYFGDFDTADKPKNPGVPFLWVGVGNSPAPAEFGKVIRL